MNKKILPKIAEICDKYEDLSSKLLLDDVINDYKKYSEIQMAKSNIEPIVLKYNEYISCNSSSNRHDQCRN